MEFCKIDNDIVTVPPKQTIEVNAEISTQNDQKTGIYDGFLKFESEHHAVNIPVSYVIVEKIEKNVPFTFVGKNDDGDGCLIIIVL